mgnify:CR=1 FL=1
MKNPKSTFGRTQNILGDHGLPEIKLKQSPTNVASNFQTMYKTPKRRQQELIAGGTWNT